MAGVDMALVVVVQQDQRAKHGTAGCQQRRSDDGVNAAQYGARVGFFGSVSYTF